MSWDIIVEQSGMAPPQARNGVTYKINVYVLDTGLWFVDSGGGTFSGAFAGDDPTGFARDVRFAVGHGSSRRIRGASPSRRGATVANTTTTPHEFTHVLQAESGGFANSDFSGPFWETHANFGASLVDDYDTGNGRAEVTTRNSIIGRYGERRHRYSLATDFRYEAHPFLNYLTELPEYGPQFVNERPVERRRRAGQRQRSLAGAAQQLRVARGVRPGLRGRSSPARVTYKALYDGALLSGSPAIPAHNTTTRLYRTFLEPVGSSPGW